MSKFSEHKKKRKQEAIEQKKERLRLKALPEPLRKLETGLWQNVDFMEVYDGYIGDFTGQIIPEKPFENPFAIINKMKLNFPHQNSLSDEQKVLYVMNIEAAFSRMGFYFKSSLFENTKHLELYELLLYHIEKPPEIGFDVLTSISNNGVTLEVERGEFNLY
jgi:hypothetical protein